MRGAHCVFPEQVALKQAVEAYAQQRPELLRKERERRDMQGRLAELEQRLEYVPDEEAKTVIAQRLSYAALLEERVKPAPDTPERHGTVQSHDLTNGNRSRH